jgi:hypothetical protein
LVTLLRPLHAGMALGALMDQWRIPIGSKPAIARWLLDHRVLMPHFPCAGGYVHGAAPASSKTLASRKSSVLNPSLKV